MLFLITETKNWKRCCMTNSCFPCRESKIQKTILVTK